MNTPENLATFLNRECGCRVTDLAALRRRVDVELESIGTSRSIVETHAHLFSDIPVFLDPAHVVEMRRVVAAIEAVVRSKAYQDTVLAAAPAIAQLTRAARGVFMGFDFHICADGPKLIEINTNAGGAFVNLAALDASASCCEPSVDFRAAEPSTRALEDAIFDMFLSEWRAERGDTALRSIAIVDENPAEQYLFPEFVLAKKMFERRGIECRIADPAQLERSEGRILLQGRPVDLIYNRLTDFCLQEPRNQVMREAWEANLAVVSPHPRAHALYADKRNLALLSDPQALEKIGVDTATRELLARAIPTTRPVEGAAGRWWDERKEWFFKPWRGFGSRGTYRGDKITRRVFGDIVAGEYVAQKLTPPSERLRITAGGTEAFKVDVRCYAYAGEVQLMAARLYQGQTTNFRTAGGGFAPVYAIETAALEGLRAAGCV